MRRIKLSLHPGFERLPDVTHTLATIFAEMDRASRQDLFEDFLRALFNDVRAAHKRRALNTGQPDSYWDSIPLEIHVSVPAMWNDEQRGVIRNSAQRVAKACGKSSKDPMIDLREEALCVATYFLSKDLSVQVGSVHIFVDVGDGTLDITTVIVVRARSLSAPMQLRRLGLCSGSGASIHMANAEAETWVIKKYGEVGSTGSAGSSKSVSTNFPGSSGKRSIASRGTSTTASEETLTMLGSVAAMAGWDQAS